MRQYCKKFLGGVTNEDTEMFMTQKMVDAFASEKHRNLKALFHIVLTKDGKDNFVSKIELENRQNKHVWSPVQTKIIKALERANMVPLNHKNSSVSVYISGTRMSLVLLTAKEQMEHFAVVRSLLDQRLAEFQKTVTALEDIIDKI